jgi:hypothetical protein
VAVAAFTMNGTRVSPMERTIAGVGGAVFEFFTGKPLPPPPKPKPAAGRRAAKRPHKGS